MAEIPSRTVLFLIGKHVCRLLSEGEQLVGRAPECGICVNEPTVSRHHARITVADGKVTVEDLDSSNGTTVDGVPITKATLPLLAQVHFGKATFQLISRNIPIGPEIHDASTDRLERPGRPAETISAAENRVLVQMLDGHSEKEIARRLHLSPHTVHNHIRRIYDVLQISSRAELLRLFVAGDTLSGEPPE